MLNQRAFVSIHSPPCLPRLHDRIHCAETMIHVHISVPHALHCIWELRFRAARLSLVACLRLHFPRDCEHHRFCSRIIMHCGFYVCQFEDFETLSPSNAVFFGDLRRRVVREGGERANFIGMSSFVSHRDPELMSTSDK